MRSGARAKHAAAAVSGSSVITKVIPMQGGLDQDAMEDQVQMEASNYIPYPIEEVSLDFEVLGAMPNNPEMIQVLLAASRTENVDARQSALELGGIDEGPPGLRAEGGEGFYAAYFRDLDGIKLDVFCYA